jgi:hypothetical protein
LLIANGKHSFTFGIWTIGLDPIWHLGKIVRDSASASAMKFTANLLILQQALIAQW